MAEKASAFDKEASGGGEKQDPSGVGLLGNEDFTRLQIGIVGIGDHASATTNHSRAAANALEALAIVIVSVGLWGLFGLEIIAEMGSSIGRETIGGCGFQCVAGEFSLAGFGQSGERAGAGRAIGDSKDLLDFEVKNVTRCCELIPAGKAFADLNHDAADATKDPGPLETKVLPVANPRAGLAEDPVENLPFRKSEFRTGEAVFGFATDRAPRFVFWNAIVAKAGGEVAN
ncbi:MAG: hypothetical protein AAF514_04310 [Verrucomicrobiota bacterium]